MNKIKLFPRDLLPDRLNPEELQRQEGLEERPLVVGPEMGVEYERRKKMAEASKVNKISPSTTPQI